MATTPSRFMRFLLLAAAAAALSVCGARGAFVERAARSWTPFLNNDGLAAPVEPFRTLKRYTHHFKYEHVDRDRDAVGAQLSLIYDVKTSENGRKNY